MKNSKVFQSMKARIAAATAFVFIFSSVMAPVAEANFWKERREAARRSNGQGAESAPLYAALPAADGLLPAIDESLSRSSALTPGALATLAAGTPADARRSAAPSWLRSLPAAEGEIRAVRLTKTPDRDPLVILVQDVHDVFSAQKNIAGLLNHIETAAARERLGTVLIGLEGAAGALQLAPYRANRSRPGHRITSEILLKSHLISGPEYHGFLAEKEPLFWGVETPASYVENVQAFRDSHPLAENMRATLGRLEAVLAREKSRIFSPDMAALDVMVDGYAKGTLGLTDYVRALAARAGSMKEMPQVEKLLQALALEKDLDFKRVEKERADLIAVLSARLDQKSLDTLVSAAMAYRLGETGYGAYHAQLKRLAAAQGVRWAAYPVFDRYVGYVLLSETIDKFQLFDEVEALKRRALARTARTEEERVLLALAEDLRLVSRLSRHEFGPEEWSAYDKRRDEILSLEDRLAAVTAQPLSKDLAGLIPMFERFYRAADRRNTDMTANLLAKAKDSGARVMVLVAGGFHTPALENILSKAGASSITLTPQVAEVPAGAAYLDVFLTKHIPLEKMLLGEKLYVSPPRATAKNVIPGVEPEGALGEVSDALNPVTDALAEGKPGQASLGKDSVVGVPTGEDPPQGEGARKLYDGAEGRVVEIPGQAGFVNFGFLARVWRFISSFFSPKVVDDSGAGGGGAWVRTPNGSAMRANGSKKKSPKSENTNDIYSVVSQLRDGLEANQKSGLGGWQASAQDTLAQIELFLELAEAQKDTNDSLRQLEIFKGIQAVISYPIMSGVVEGSNVKTHVTRVIALWKYVGARLEKPRLDEIKKLFAGQTSKNVKETMQSAILGRDEKGNMVIESVGPEAWGPYGGLVLAPFHDADTLRALIQGRELKLDEKGEMLLKGNLFGHQGEGGRSIGQNIVDIVLQGLKAKGEDINNPQRRLQAFVDFRNDIFKSPKAALGLMRDVGIDIPIADKMESDPELKSRVKDQAVDFLMDFEETMNLLKWRENWAIKKDKRETERIEALKKNLGLGEMDSETFALRLLSLNYPLDVLEAALERESDTEADELGRRLIKELRVAVGLFAGGEASRWKESLKQWVDAGLNGKEESEISPDLPRQSIGWGEENQDAIVLSMLDAEGQAYSLIVNPTSWEYFSGELWKKVAEGVVHPGSLNFTPQNPSEAWILDDSAPGEKVVQGKVLGHGDVLGFPLAVIEALKKGKVYSLMHAGDNPLARLNSLQVIKAIGAMAKRTLAHVAFVLPRKIGQVGGGAVEVNGQDNMMDAPIPKEENTKGYAASRDIAFFNTFVSLVNHAAYLYAISPGVMVKDQPLITWNQVIEISQGNESEIEALAERLEALPAKQMQLIVQNAQKLLPSIYVEKKDNGQTIAQWEQISGMFHGELSRAIAQRMTTEGVAVPEHLAALFVDVPLDQQHLLPKKWASLKALFAEVKSVLDYLFAKKLLESLEKAAPVLAVAVVLPLLLMAPGVASAADLVGSAASLSGALPSWVPSFAVGTAVLSFLALVTKMFWSSRARSRTALDMVPSVARQFTDLTLSALERKTLFERTTADPQVTARKMEEAGVIGVPVRLKPNTLTVVHLNDPNLPLVYDVLRLATQLGETQNSGLLVTLEPGVNESVAAALSGEKLEEWKALLAPSAGSSPHLAMIELGRQETAEFGTKSDAGAWVIPLGKAVDKVGLELNRLLSINVIASPTSTAEFDLNGVPEHIVNFLLWLMEGMTVPVVKGVEDSMRSLMETLKNA